MFYYMICHVYYMIWHVTNQCNRLSYYTTQCTRQQHNTPCSKLQYDTLHDMRYSKLAIYHWIQCDILHYMCIQHNIHDLYIMYHILGYIIYTAIQCNVYNNTMEHTVLRYHNTTLHNVYNIYSILCHTIHTTLHNVYNIYTIYTT